MKKLATAACLLALVIVAGCGQGPDTSTTATAAPTTSSTSVSLVTYSADLSGKNETPAVTTSASGSATFTLDPSGSTVAYVIDVTMISGVTVARIHVGKTGATGGAILTLFPGPTKKGLFSGVLAQGSFTAAKLSGTLKGHTIADLVALIKSGEVYLNIGTTKHPSGEIRGQFQ